MIGCRHLSALDLLDGMAPCRSCQFDQALHNLDAPLPGTSWDNEQHTSIRVPWWKVELPFLLLLLAGGAAWVLMVLWGMDTLCDDGTVRSYCT